jgi:hypothetical protein
LGEIAYPAFEPGTGEPLSAPCPLARSCTFARASCRVFAPGWYCEDRDLIVFPSLLLDADYEQDADYA